MLILDDILMAPIHGLLWTARKIKEAADNELENQRQRTRSELSELYMQLETGKISEEEFDTREKQLLDRLDRLQKTQAAQADPPPESPWADPHS